MNRRFGLTIFAAMMVLAGSAVAQKSALVQDRDEPGRSPYQQEQGVNPSPAICPNSFFCVITFAAVPVGHRLVVTHAAVEFTNGIAGAGVAYVSGPAGISGPRFIIPPDRERLVRSLARSIMRFRDGGSGRSSTSRRGESATGFLEGEGFGYFWRPELGTGARRGEWLSR